MPNNEELNYYISESKKAIEQLSNEGTKVKEVDFQVALGECMGYDRYESTKIANHKLSAEEMLKLLKSKNIQFPELICEIKYYVSILPPGCISRIDEERIKVNGEIWLIHKYDSDTLPSNPHAQNSETGQKLHLGTGDLYDYKNNSLDKRVKRKILLEIRSKVKNIKLPDLVV